MGELALLFQNVLLDRPDHRKPRRRGNSMILLRLTGFHLDGLNPCALIHINTISLDLRQQFASHLEDVSIRVAFTAD
jgi:hypothetical protein